MSEELKHWLVLLALVTGAAFIFGGVWAAALAALLLISVEFIAHFVRKK